MELDRRFVEYTGKSSPESFEFYGSLYNSMGWGDLLQRRRVVVLAEAGSGKSEEFKIKAGQITSSGRTAFVRTVTEAAELGFEASLSRAERQALERWRESDRPAWFFLDSVDEAKSRRLNLGRALKSLADAIEGGERRAHIFLSGRPSDWEASRDLFSLADILAVPPQPAPAEPVDAGARVMNILRGRSPKPPSAEEPLAVAMLPLDDDRVSRFARGKGIHLADPFLEGLERQGLLRFARRPLDLKWLVEHWSERGSFDSLRGMLELSLNHRLRETNPDHARVDDLSLDACNKAANRIGAAMVLRRVDSVAIPEPDADLDPAFDALDLEALLPDWAPAERVRLLARAAFSPSRSGHVRLDNDNQGAVRSFLAARWISSLLEAHCPRSRIRELLFADIYGERVIIPSMAQTVAWLAIGHPWIAEEALSRDPWSLLNLGDPQSLPLDLRARILKAMMAVDELLTFDRIPDQAALRRLAQPDMAATIRSLWGDFNQAPRARSLLLQLIWLGRLEACGDIAAEASFGAFPDPLSEIFAGRAIAAAGSRTDKARYGAYLAERRADVASEVFWDGVEELFPEHFGARELAEALSDRDLRKRSSSQELARHASALASKLKSAEQFEALLAVALDAIHGEPPHDEGHPLWGLAEACAEGLLLVNDQSAARSPLAVAAYIESCDFHRYRPMGLTTRSERLRSILSSTPENRRSTLWTAAQALATAPFPPVTHPSQLEICGVQIGLAPEDASWLLEDAATRSEDTDAQLAVNAIMRMGPGTSDSESVLAELRRIGVLRPVVARTLKAWTDPEPRSAQEVAMTEEVRAMSERHAQQARKAETGWRDFVADLRADPQQLRAGPAPSADGVDSRVVLLWELIDKKSGDQTRFSDRDESALLSIFGSEVVMEFRAALSRMWRLWTPTPEPERPDDQKNRLNAADLIGLFGVSVEARCNPQWAATLSDEDATKATLYATLELNALPGWLPDLAAARPDAVRDALLRCCFGEWDRDASEPFPSIFDRISRSSASICELVAPAILRRIQGNCSAPAGDAPASNRVLEHAAEVTRKGIADGSSMAPIWLRLAESATGSERRAIYLAEAFAANPTLACEATDQMLNTLDAHQRKALVSALMPRIFGGDWSRAALGSQAMPLAMLRRLVEVAHRELPPQDDPYRATDQVYSPDARDHAQYARSNALTALVERPGLATYEAINELLRTGFPADPVVMKRWAQNRARADAERARWHLTEFTDFERNFIASPRTPKDLQTIAMNRFADLQDELINSDFNQGATVAALPDEAAVQNWFADRFKREAHGSFSITRESHMADEKEPDLRLEAKASDAALPIEIKIAERWSRVQLEDALRVQLMGRYLRAQDGNWGILLLVHQTPRVKGWEDGQGGYLDIHQVMDWLCELARKIGLADTRAPQMRVALVDVSSERVKAS